MVGFETEVTLLASTDPIAPVHCKEWCDALTLSSGSRGASVTRQIADSLQRAGIVLEMYHVGAAPGQVSAHGTRSGFPATLIFTRSQYEFVTGPLPPLESADALISTREIIAATASHSGLRATLSPRIFTPLCQSLNALCMYTSKLMSPQIGWKRSTRAYFSKASEASDIQANERQQEGPRPKATGVSGPEKARNFFLGLSIGSLARHPSTYPTPPCFISPRARWNLVWRHLCRVGHSQQGGARLSR